LNARCDAVLGCVDEPDNRGLICDNDPSSVCLAGVCTETGEPDALRDLTALHNEARDEVVAAPLSPLPPLSWDPQLGALAQAHTDDCVVEFDVSLRDPTTGGFVGQTIATGPFSAPELAQLWIDEGVGYTLRPFNFATETAPNYTQVIWSDTSRLGCGITACGGASNFLFCLYAPFGNVPGQLPYQPAP
jgi:pathogenesis-related protein 1